MIRRDYVEPEGRDQRGGARSELELLLVQQQGRCAICQVDLGELAERRHTLQAALYDWIKHLYDRGIPFPGHWALTHEERGREYPNPVFAALRAMGFDKPDHPLAEKDHITPLWAGGTDDLSNKQALCQPCHRAKTGFEAGERARKLMRAKLRRLRAWR